MLLNFLCTVGRRFSESVWTGLDQRAMWAQIASDQWVKLSAMIARVDEWIESIAHSHRKYFNELSFAQSNSYSDLLLCSRCPFIIITVGAWPIAIPNLNAERNSLY